MLPPSVSLLPVGTFIWPALVLIGVVGLILLTQRIVRASGVYPRQGARRISIIEATALDQRRRLHLVRCDNRTVLLLTGGTQDLVVGWLPEPQP